MRATLLAVAVALSVAGVDWDKRYKKGWAYGKEPNKFLAESAAKYIAVAVSPGATGVAATPAVATEPAGETKESVPMISAETSTSLKILSLAEGQGRNVVHLAKAGHRCTAVDSSSVGLAKTVKLAEENGVGSNIAVLEADLHRFHPAESGDSEGEGQWDGILSIFCTLLPAARARLHRECAASLRPGGLVIIECFAPRQHTQERPAAAPALDGDVAVEEKERQEKRSWQRAGPTDPRMLVSHADLVADFAGLEVLVAREVDRVLDEGRFHRGPAVLTQFVARKPFGKGKEKCLPAQCNVVAAEATAAAAAGNADVASQLAVAMPSQPAHRSHARFKHAIDSIFADVQTAAVAEMLSDAALCDSAVKAHMRAVQETAEYGEEGLIGGANAAVVDIDDKILFSAWPTLQLVCRLGAVTRCRYCWLPNKLCLCATFEGVGARLPSQREKGSDAECSPLSAVQIRWVIIQHPNEFMRSTASARFAPLLLGGAVRPGDECELLLYGAPSQVDRIDELLRSESGHARLLFPGKPGRLNPPPPFK